jgi:hypothetical protein
MEVTGDGTIDGLAPTPAAAAAAPVAAPKQARLAEERDGDEKKDGVVVVAPTTRSHRLQHKRLASVDQTHSH